MLLPASAHGQSEEPVLTGRMAIERIIGNTLVLTPAKPDPAINIKSFAYFSPDGRAAMQITVSDPASTAEKKTSEEGDWSIDDQGRLCVVKEGGIVGDHDCAGMTVTGNTVRSMPKYIFEGAIVTLVEGNPHGL